MLPVHETEVIPDPTYIAYAAWIHSEFIAVCCSAACCNGVFVGLTYGKLFRPFCGSDGSEHQWGRRERSELSNFIVKQEGPSPRVAEKVWEVRLGTGSLLLGALAGVLAGLYLGRRGSESDRAPRPKDWPVNFAHRGGADIAPENTLEGFRNGIRVGAGVLELDVHTTADGHVVVIHDATVDRTTQSTGAVREMTLAEIKSLDAGYRFSSDGGRTFPHRDQGIKVPTLEEVYDEFDGVPINVEIKGKRPGIEEAVWRIIEAAGGAGRTPGGAGRMT